MKFASSILFPLLAASYVSAHGILLRIAIDDKSFEGNKAGGPANPSVIRQVSSQDPNKGANNPALTCGPNSRPAALVADANPGDTISFDWRTADGGRWPHNIGPMLTYMASCGSVTCDKFNQANAQWFKIHEVGRKANSNEWVQEDLRTGGVAPVPIPSNLAPGNYLVRHEIIALHLATSVGGAEFYPACAQLKIGGNGNGAPQAGELVRLPGAYTDNDPGIFAPNVFNSKVPYVMPGPKVAAFVAGSGNGGNVTPSTPTPSSPPSSSQSKSSPSVSVSPAAAAPPATKICKKKKKQAAPSVADPSPASVAAAAGASPPASSPKPVSDYRPRHLGHVMRRIAFENSFH